MRQQSRRVTIDDPNRTNTDLRSQSPTGIHLSATNGSTTPDYRRLPLRSPRDLSGSLQAHPNARGRSRSPPILGKRDSPMCL